jgi:endonuclease/exonuclease/phosphatase family metal-dependent hydrolase
VRWFTPAADDQRRRLDAWCATVGTPIVHQPPTLSTTPLSTTPLGRRIALVSWNVHVGGGDIAALNADLQSGRLTAGEVLPFVLLLQEAFRTNDDIPVWRSGQPAPPRIAPRPPSGTRVPTPDLARRLGLHLIYVPSMRNGPGDASHREDRGPAILSTMTLTDPHAIELPFERQRRVAVAARIANVTHDDDLWVVNVHLENRTGGRRFWLEAPSARARQARALVKKFLPDGPAILGGDLNTWASNEPTIDLLKDVFDTPVGDDSRDTLPGVGRIDYLLARLPSGWTMTSRRLDSQYGSDHFPVLGILSLPEPLVASRAN